VLVPLGQNLLEAAHENNVDLEGETVFNVSTLQRAKV
jgi:3-deoxy-D-manno-octulosonic-acid transferase